MLRGTGAATSVDSAVGVAADAGQLRQSGVLERTHGQAHPRHFHGFLDADDGPVFEVRVHEDSWTRPCPLDSVASPRPDAAAARKRGFQGLPHRMVRRHGGLAGVRCRGRLEILRGAKMFPTGRVNPFAGTWRISLE